MTQRTWTAVDRGSLALLSALSVKLDFRVRLSLNPEQSLSCRKPLRLALSASPTISASRSSATEQWCAGAFQSFTSDSLIRPFTGFVAIVRPGK